MQSIITSTASIFEAVFCSAIASQFLPRVSLSESTILVGSLVSLLIESQKKNPKMSTMPSMVGILYTFYTVFVAPDQRFSIGTSNNSTKPPPSDT